MSVAKNGLDSIMSTKIMSDATDKTAGIRGLWLSMVSMHFSVGD